MPLLLTQNDIRQLINGEDFVEDIFQVIQGALFRQSGKQGHMSWLAFPLLQEGRRININALSVSDYGVSVRIFPVSGGPRPSKDGYLALLLDGQDGQVKAFIAMDDLNPLRTSAPVGLACRYLAPRHATTLAMLGSGTQARYHLHVLHRAIPSLKTVHVYSPTTEHRYGYATEMSKQTGLQVESTTSAKEAIVNRDIVCITAASREPLFEAAWIKPGALITSLTGQGLPSDLRARVVVPTSEGPEVRSSGWDPWPILAAMGGRNTVTTTTTLIEVMHGTAQARSQSDEIVLYEQRGAYVWDAAIIDWVYRWAHHHHVGTNISLTSS
jgi:ornithine cyclodeaminase/alanine dehydrogenase-like protein (mu-crystallin family)